MDKLHAARIRSLPVFICLVFLLIFNEFASNFIRCPFSHFSVACLAEDKLLHSRNLSIISSEQIQEYQNVAYHFF